MGWGGENGPGEGGSQGQGLLGERGCGVKWSRVQGVRGGPGSGRRESLGPGWEAWSQRVRSQGVPGGGSGTRGFQEEGPGSGVSGQRWGCRRGTLL